MRTIRRRILPIVLAAGLALGATACEGDDTVNDEIQDAEDAVEEGASEAEDAVEEGASEIEEEFDDEGDGTEGEG